MENNSSNSHSHENQHMGGSNNSQNSTENIFINQAEIAWYERRKQWVGVPSKKSQRVFVEPIMSGGDTSTISLASFSSWSGKFRGCLLYMFSSWTTTYEDLLCSTEPFQQGIPLAEMVDSLVDIWHEDGLYD